MAVIFKGLTKRSCLVRWVGWYVMLVETEIETGVCGKIVSLSLLAGGGRVSMSLV